MKHVVKRAGYVQIYERQKLYNSVYAAALSVREPIDSASLTADTVVKEVEDWMKDKKEVTSHDIRVQAGKALRNIHPDAAQVFNHHKVVWE